MYAIVKLINRAKGKRKINLEDGDKSCPQLRDTFNPFSLIDESVFQRICVATMQGNESDSWLVTTLNHLSALIKKNI